MGRLKAAKDRQDELGYSPIENKWVCADCFDDYAIKEFIEIFEKIGSCSYCDNKYVNISDFSQVIDFIMEGVNTEWGNPENEGIPWESREGGWQYPVNDTSDVLFGSIGLDVGEKLQDDIIKSTSGSQWVKIDPYGLSRDRVWQYGWEAFCEMVKYQTRYVFFKTVKVIDEYSSDEIDPVGMLELIARMSDDLNLIQPLMMGTKILRIRVVETNESPSLASEIGTPLVQYAKYSNRMSPAGIPIFYGAFEYETALKETYTPKHGIKKKIVCGTFELKSDIHILDLTNLQAVPSIFDESDRHFRTAIIFFHAFVNDLSKKIQKDGREHIEYVPTQIVTEYFKHLFHIFEDLNREKIYGIVYPSSQNLGGKACVLFSSNEQCIDKGTTKKSLGKPILELINVTSEVLGLTCQHFFGHLFTRLFAFLRNQQKYKTPSAPR